MKIDLRRTRTPGPRGSAIRHARPSIPHIIEAFSIAFPRPDQGVRVDTMEREADIRGVFEARKLLDWVEAVAPGAAPTDLPDAATAGLYALCDERPAPVYFKTAEDARRGDYILEYTPLPTMRDFKTAFPHPDQSIAEGEQPYTVKVRGTFVASHLWQWLGDNLPAHMGLDPTTADAALRGRGYACVEIRDRGARAISCEQMRDIRTFDGHPGLSLVEEAWAFEQKRPKDVIEEIDEFRQKGYMPLSFAQTIAAVESHIERIMNSGIPVPLTLGDDFSDREAALDTANDRAERIEFEGGGSLVVAPSDSASPRRLDMTVTSSFPSKAQVVAQAVAQARSTCPECLQVFSGGTPGCCICAPLVPSPDIDPTAALTFLNETRARAGRRALDPAEAGYTNDDIVADARTAYAEGDEATKARARELGLDWSGE